MDARVGVYGSGSGASGMKEGFRVQDLGKAILMVQGLGLREGNRRWELQCLFGIL